MDNAERLAATEKVFTAMYNHMSNTVPHKPSWTVAEFGVGKRGFGRFYAQKFSRVLGIDIEDYSACHPGVEFFLSRADRTAIESATADMTVSHSVLEHVEDLDAAMAEINRITKPGGYLFLTVSPLYFSSYGAHLRRDGQRLENWEHLDPTTELYMIRNPMQNARTSGHALNMLTSAKFLGAVGRLPWEILSYKIQFERKPIPEFVDRSIASELDLTLRDFRFIGRRVPQPRVE